MAICFVRFVFLFLWGWFCFFEAYILLCMIWLILLIGILLDGKVDLLLCLSCLIECLCCLQHLFLFFLLSLFFIEMITCLVIWVFFDFVMSVLMFVVSIVFLIVSPNVISILLRWDGLSLVSHMLVIYYQNVESFIVLVCCWLFCWIGLVMWLH